MQVVREAPAVPRDDVTVTSSAQVPLHGKL